MIFSPLFTESEGITECDNDSLAWTAEASGSFLRSVVKEDEKHRPPLPLFESLLPSINILGLHCPLVFQTRQKEVVIRLYCNPQFLHGTGMQRF